MRQRAVFAFLTVFLFSGHALAKENQPSPLTDKAFGMNFAIPTGGKATAGILWLLSPDTLIEVDVGFNLADTGSDTTWGLMLQPGLRYYFIHTGPVSLFVKGWLAFAKNKDVDATMALFGGLGVEWFVTDTLSLSGATGLGINLMPTDYFGLGTMSHGLSANIYW